MNLIPFFGNSSRLSLNSVSYSFNKFYSDSSHYAVSNLQCKNRIIYYNSLTQKYEFSLLLFDVKSEQKQSIAMAIDSVKHRNNLFDF